MFGHVGKFFGKIYRLGFILKYLLYLPKAVLAIAVGQTTCGGKALGSCLTGEVQDTGTHFIGLILITDLLQYPADIMFHIFVYGGGLLNEPFGRPLHHGAVLGAEVFGNGGVTIVMAVAGMMRYDVVVIADLNIGRRIGQLHLLAYVGMGNAVVVDILMKTCITILVDRCNNMLFHLVTDRVQRSEGFLLHVLEVTAARVVATIQVLVVVLLKRYADSYIERPKIRAVKRFDNREDVL